MKCTKPFPNRFWIDGIQRNIRNRVNCLDCVPFKKEISLYAGTPCVCTVCGRKYLYARKRGHTLKKCNSCMANSRRQERLQKMIDYKGGECVRCGYNRHPAGFDFHHVDQKTKKFGISGNHTRKWSIIVEELDKCILVCATCHREIEAGV